LTNRIHTKQQTKGGMLGIHGHREPLTCPVPHGTENGDRSSTEDWVVGLPRSYAAEIVDTSPELSYKE
jgi:hypothetical protein